ncbi:hypothetical protein C1T21_00615 [Paenibacillus sp. F4]|nr:hypothetical protein C1T21_00615 [Paenibacillus sp. F4]
MQQLLKRVEAMKAQQKTSSLENQGQKKSLFPKNSYSELEAPEGCPKCDYTGTINTFRWIEKEGYTDKRGAPMKVQVAQVEPCSCLLDRQLAKYTANSSFNHEQKQHTFKNAVIDAKNAEHFAIATDFLNNIDSHKKDGTWLYIFGDETRIKGNQSAYGTGKTFLMDCIANALAERRMPGLYVTEETLFGDIKSTYSRNSEESENEVLSRYYNVPVLMIDDLFTAPYTEWSEGKLYSILNERMQNGMITIITSNYSTDRIHERLPLNGRKIASRIVGQAQRIEMIGPDRREKKARDRLQ